MVISSAQIDNRFRLQSCCMDSKDIINESTSHVSASHLRFFIAAYVITEKINDFHPIYSIVEKKQDFGKPWLLFCTRLVFLKKFVVSNFVINCVTFLQCISVFVSFPSSFGSALTILLKYNWRYDEVLISTSIQQKWYVKKLEPSTWSICCYSTI